MHPFSENHLHSSLRMLKMVSFLREWRSGLPSLGPRLSLTPPLPSPTTPPSPTTSPPPSAFSSRGWLRLRSRGGGGFPLLPGRARERPGGYRLLRNCCCSPVTGQFRVETMESLKASQGFNRSLYPPIEPYSSGFLRVSDLHTLNWEQPGNPSGHFIVFLHGEPGAGTSASNRRFYNPEFYRIVLFDQIPRADPLDDKIHRLSTNINM